MIAVDLHFNYIGLPATLICLGRLIQSKSINDLVWKKRSHYVNAI